ncbi:MAG TPA: hypothetical protein VJO35_12600 [Terriglobales bacterium]|nr:hypothetical protein [Terriglobales bacterium]
MKRIMWIGIIGLLTAAPSWLAAQESGNYDHGSVGIFADYFRFSPGASTTNFVGFGARAAFNASHYVALEGEMNYDFERNFTTVCHNCASTSFSTTRLRPLTGLFGPRFETPGPFKFFVTGKVGFINFTTTSSAVTPGSVGNSISSVGGGGTHFAVYPGAGIEGFWGPFGLRAEVGDEVYFSNGTFNNLRITFGPQLRF